MIARREAAREARVVATNAPLLLGLLGVVAVVAIALFGEYLAPYDPQRQRVIIFYPDGTFAGPPTPPSELHRLGTDPLGRDILSRLLWGAQLTLTATALAVLARVLLGTAVGLLAGWRRGPVDAVAVHVTNALGGFPQLMLALLLVVALRDAGLPGFVLALSVVGWSEIAQFVRAEVIRLRAQPYVDAARALGVRLRGIVTGHVLRNLAPQLLGIAALEAGSVLILLAELGFIGFFVSGGAFYVDDSGRPVLPVRDRAPEWGQMLAGARHYAFSNQWVAFVPALVVTAAVFAFNLFGEGVRAAIDPFGPRRLSPRTIAVGTRLGATAAIIGALVFGVATVRSVSLTFDEGLRLAREAAAREAPESVLVATVVRFRSDAYALSRPEKVNYYFLRSADDRRLLRVSFVGMDRNAMEVKHFADDDDLPWDTLRPLDGWAVPWERALEVAESTGGTAWRNSVGAYAVLVTLQQVEAWPTPAYRVWYRQPTTRLPVLDLPVHAGTGSADLPFEYMLEDARARARTGLRIEPALLSVSATWSEASTFGGFGLVSRPRDPRTPLFVSFYFARGEEHAAVGVSYDHRRGLQPTLHTALRGFTPDGSEAPLSGEQADVRAAFLRCEEAGGRAWREALVEPARTQWTAEAFVSAREGHPVAEVSYSSRFFGGDGPRCRIDLGTGRLERLD